ncbi:hypothetical protein G3A_09985 [Bacillus sp. 17376]|nr:hypothetical protein G3A_09985 [Bacillus sp. 17376]
MSSKTQLQMVKLFLEDKIRLCKQSMMDRHNKCSKRDLRLYNELLGMLRDAKH